MITKGALRKNLTPYYFLLPAILVLAVVILYPVFSNLIMSLYKVKLFRGAGDEFIGLTHYAKLFGSRTFVNSIWSSVRFTLYSLPVAFVLGLGMALIFNEMVLAVVILYPVFSNLVMSVYKVKLFRGAGDEFIGLTHYAKLFGSRTFVNSIWSSVRFTLYSLPVAFVLGLGMALIFNEIRKYRPVFTGFLLIPWAIAPVVTGYMWRWLFHDSFGLVNHTLLSLGFIDANVPWLAQPDTAIGAVVVANVWRFMPYITIMLLAGLQGVSSELYEAAHVDGANVFERFFHVTLPQLKHVIGVVFLFATIWMVNDFALIFIMTEGGPAKATQVVPITVYRIAFEHLRLGKGAAAALILLLFLLSLSIVFIRMLFREERRSGDAN